MDFARKQLEKYGWAEGEGLGKNRDGISKPLRPKLKFDNAGLGHDISQEFTDDWWRKLYDEAASNVVTKKENDSVVLETKNETIEINKRKRKKSKREKGEMYEGFIKTAELNGLSEKNLNDSVDCDSVTKISNEELFKICGGRTIHKGARHGLKMSAKLARLQEHESSIMATLESSNISDEVETKTKTKKKKKSKK
ncbi:UNVERIFIED_CONTAM: hypothetical protein PYX00_006073 [Menopon gallinae]|uniref:G patch domain-containing protein 4 n=1 Tax=Menopon gallinae TaxID=328185 RepID=A0AAW2HU38_9NEOP